MQGSGTPYSHGRSFLIPPKVSTKLKTTAQLEPQVFCDYIGEVKFYKYDHNHPIRVTMIMTDYTDHPRLPSHQDDDRMRGIMVTLWDEHAGNAHNLDIRVGQYLYLKNLNCKVNKNGNIELNMNGYRGRGLRITDPIRKLESSDQLVAALQTRKDGVEFKAALANNDFDPADIDPDTAFKTEDPDQATGLGFRSPATALEPTSSQHLLVIKAEDSSIQTKSGAASSQGPWESSVMTQSFAETTTATAHSSELPIATPMFSKSPAVKHEILSPQKPSTAMTSSVDSLPIVSPTFEDTPHGLQSRTRILLDTLKSIMRNKRKNSVQDMPEYIKLQARVTQFEPSDIRDFSAKICLRCGTRWVSSRKRCYPPCKSTGSDVQFKFTLTLMDEVNQKFYVHVDKEGAGTLLGPDIPACDLTNPSNAERLEKLRTKLRRIGVIEREHGLGSSKEPIRPLLDICVQLRREKSHGSSSGTHASTNDANDKDHSETNGAMCLHDDEDESMSFNTQPAEDAQLKRKGSRPERASNRKRACARDEPTHMGHLEQAQGEEILRMYLVCTAIK